MSRKVFGMMLLLFVWLGLSGIFVAFLYSANIGISMVLVASLIYATAIILTFMLEAPDA